MMRQSPRSRRLRKRRPPRTSQDYLLSARSADKCEPMPVCLQAILPGINCCRPCGGNCESLRRCAGSFCSEFCPPLAHHDIRSSTSGETRRICHCIVLGITVAMINPNDQCEHHFDPTVSGCRASGGKRPDLAADFNSSSRRKWRVAHATARGSGGILRKGKSALPNWSSHLQLSWCRCCR